MLGSFFVLLIKYRYLHKGLEYSDITFATLYVNVPVWSMITRNFKFATVMSSKGYAKYSNLYSIPNYESFYIESPEIALVL